MLIGIKSLARGFRPNPYGSMDSEGPDDPKDSTTTCVANNDEPEQQQQQHKENGRTTPSSSSPPPPSSSPSSSSSSSSLVCRLCLETHLTRAELEDHMIFVHSVRPDVLKLVLLMNDQHRQHFNDMKSLMRNLCNDEDRIAFQDPKNGARESSPSNWQQHPRLRSVQGIPGFRMSVKEMEDLEIIAKNLIQEADAAALSKHCFTHLCRCPICQEDFTTVESLFSHQNELGHLELRQHSTQHPGYVCWFPRCDQSFSTASSLQQHYSFDHAARADKLQNGMMTDACHSCEVVFEDASLLERHTLFHVLEDMKSCKVCSEDGGEKTFDDLNSSIQHLRSTHSDLEGTDLLKNFEKLFSIVNKYSTKHENKSKRRQESHSNKTTTTRDSSSSETEEDKANPIQNCSQTEDSNISDPNSEAAEQRYNADDPSCKYKCHRCKMAFRKQTQIMVHNRSAEHRCRNKSDSNDPADLSNFEDGQRETEERDLDLSRANSEETLSRPDETTRCHQATDKQRNPLYPEDFSELKDNNAEVSPRKAKDAFDGNETPNNYSEDADWKDSSFSSDMTYEDSSGKEPTARHRFSSGSKITCMKCLNFVGTSYELMIHQQTNCNGFGRSLSRHRSSYYRTLLENVGFECAMLFNESFKNIGKKSNPPTQDKDPDKSAQDSTKTPDGSTEKTLSRNFDIPELNRSLCRYCSKEFSSVWVLKAHEEEEHNGAVPLELVEQFAQAFRKRYEKQNQHQFPSLNNSDMFKSQFDRDNQSNSPHKSGKVTPYSNGNGGAQYGPSNPQISNFASMFKNLSGDLAHMADFNSPAFKLEMMKQMSMMMMMPGMDISALGGANPLLGMPMIPPPLLPMMFPFGFSPEMFGFPGLGMMFDPATLANGHQGEKSLQNHSFTGMPGASVMMPQSIPPLANSLFAQQQLVNNANLNNSISAAQQQKRARTRITDEQLSILRAHFDISNSPSDEQIAEMALATQLPPKVIKHWFRNTLFKERQRSKDSPYNFNNPPTTLLSSGDGEDEPGAESSASETNNINSNNNNNNNNTSSNVSSFSNNNNSNLNKTKCSDIGQDDKEKLPAQTTTQDSNKEIKKETLFYQDTKSGFGDNEPSASVTPAQIPSLPQSLFAPGNFSRLGPHCNPGFFLPPTAPLFPHAAGLPFPPAPGTLPLFGSPHPQQQPQTTNHGKRANRTHFTDQQIKILQEHFEINAYPKDEELEMLSGLLDLSPRVIIVWFQNARQKARKSYENQPQLNSQNPEANPNLQNNSEGSQPALKYQCQVCSANFERYYELIKHQRLQCHKDSSFRGTGSLVSNDPKGSLSSSMHSSIEKFKTKSECLRPTMNLPNQPVPTMSDKLQDQFVKQESDSSRKGLDAQNSSGFSSQQKKQPPNDTTAPKFTSEGNACQDSDEKEAGPSNPDRRMRTVILPDQLEYLNRKFREDSNPSRKQLRAITAEVGLSKRVVQVWFQNARARERKGPSSSSNQSLKHTLSGSSDGFGQIPEKKIKSEIGVDGKSGEKLAIPHVNMSQLMNNPYSLHPPFLPFFPPMNLFYPGDGMKVFPGNKQQETAMQKCLEVYNSAKLNCSSQQPSATATSSLSSSNFVKPPFKQSHAMDGNLKPSNFSRQSSTAEMPLDLSKPLKCKIIADASGTSFGDESTVDFSKKRTKYESESQSDNDDYLNACNSRDEDYPRPFRGFGSEGGNSLIPPIHYPDSFTNSSNRIFEGNNQQNSSSLTPSSGKRHRTHMSSLQIRVMKAIYSEYKTPTISECEMLGRDIGLRKRVVQVWFQNARAKDKKNRLADGLDGDLPAMQTPASTECKLCGVRYTPNHTVRDHLFSSEHVEVVKKFVKTQSETEQQPFHHESPLKQMSFAGDRQLGSKDYFGPDSKLPTAPSFPMSTPGNLMGGLVNPELMAKFQRDLGSGTEDKPDKLVHQQYPDSQLKPTIPGFSRLPLPTPSFPAMLPSFMPHHNLQRLFPGLDVPPTFPTTDTRSSCVPGPEASNLSGTKDSLQSDSPIRGQMNYSPSTSKPADEAPVEHGRSTLTQDDAME